MNRRLLRQADGSATAGHKEKALINDKCGVFDVLDNFPVADKHTPPSKRIE